MDNPIATQATMRPLKRRRKSQVGEPADVPARLAQFNDLCIKVAAPTTGQPE
jgi:hypothetical protein